MTSWADRVREINIAAIRAAAGRKKRLKRPRAQIFPDTAEREYRRELGRIPDKLIKTTRKILIPELPKILTMAAKNRPSIDSLRADEYDYSIELANLMALIRAHYDGIYSEAVIADLVRRVALAVSAQNGKELGKVFRSVLGVDLFASEPWLAGEMSAFVKQNVSLIKTLPDRYFPAIEQKVFDAARQGISSRVLSADLRKAFDATRYQAERIASDQIGKFNGQLTRIRQTQAGIRRYFWRTSLDERVRKQHREREGQIFYWDDPPADGHPGEPIRCRCYAEPDISDLLDFSE